MSISEDMVVDKLKGHTYTWSVYQHAEIHSHMDAEMTYIIGDAVDRFRIKVSAQNNYRVIDLCMAVTYAAILLIAEREKFKNSDNIKLPRAATAMSRAYMNFKGQLTTMNEIVDTLLPYAIYDILTQIRYCSA